MKKAAAMERRWMVRTAAVERLANSACVWRRGVFLVWLAGNEPPSHG